MSANGYDTGMVNVAPMPSQIGTTVARDPSVRDDLTMTLDRLQKQTAMRAKELDMARARYQDLERDVTLLTDACEQLAISLNRNNDRDTVPEPRYG